MKKTDKITAAAGIAAGAVTAAVPAAISMLKSRGNPDPAPRPEKISCDGSGFQLQSGEEIKLRILAVRNYSLDIESREKLCSRFGPYGMAQVVREFEKSMLTDKDIAYVAGLGFNCISISFSYILIYPNGKIGKKPDFTALDGLVESCCRNGLYAALNLTDARTFAKKEKPEKALLKIWKLIAEHYKTDSAVALYDLTAPGFEGDFENYCRNAVKAIRKSDFEKEIIAPVNSGVKFTYSSNAGGSSLIFDETAPHTEEIEKAYTIGKSVMFEPFKSDYVSLITLVYDSIDLSTDSYEELLRKYAALNDKTIKDDILAGAFEKLFGDEPAGGFGNIEEKKSKLHFSAGFRRGTELTTISR